MSRHAWFLLVALLSSPAWSQEPAAPGLAPIPRSFDPGTASIRKIVRDNAATQYAQVLPTQQAAVEAAPVRQPAPPHRVASPSDRFFAVLIDSVVETLLDDEWDDSRLACQAGAEPEITTQGYATCVRVNRENLWAVGSPLAYVLPKKPEPERVP